MHLGIDVSKNTLDCCLISDGIFYERKFKNDSSGIDKLQTWLQEHGADSNLHCCCEATGTYYEESARALSRRYKMSVVNPRTIKGFGTAVMNRSKTDRQDAKLIARYCQAMKPEQWQSATPEHRQLQELVRYIARTKRQRAAEQIKRQTAPDSLKPHIQSTIEHLTELLTRLEQDLKAHYRSHPEHDSRRKRLKTIDGIGENAAAVLCSVITDRFTHAKQLVAYLGLDPKEHQSGTSVRGRTRISKIGKSDIRAALYMPAFVAYRMGAFPDFTARLEAKGKPPKVIIVAIMRKLAVIAFNLLKNGEEFDRSRYRKI
ncbi:IS110 family transposase [Neisseria lactamica]|uniref:IS110 family transposase n=1 Tax=Neisseria lactamica TaxID=486 RepID=UPI000E5899B1|nr:IS110 family transposase [Neisseria lactamica]